MWFRVPSPARATSSSAYASARGPATSVNASLKTPTSSGPAPPPTRFITASSVAAESARARTSAASWTIASVGPTKAPLNAQGTTATSSTSIAPYARVAAAQRRGNVMLLQEPSLSCVPCQREGCERNRSSFSACLDTMSPAAVIAAAKELLTPAAASPQP